MADINIHDNRENPIQTLIGVFIAIAAVLVLFGLAPGVLIASILHSVSTDLTMGKLWAVTIVGSIATLILCKSIFKDWRKTLIRYSITAVCIGIFLIVAALVKSDKFVGHTLATMFDEIKQIPDEEKIKNDLIGNKIGGWNFDYLSEFKEFKVLNVMENPKRLEYDIYTKLYDEKNNDSHECELRVVYVPALYTHDWELDKIWEKYITYEFNAPINQWNQFKHPVPDADFTITGSTGKYLLQDPCNKKEFKLGGNDDDNLSVSCADFNLMSREEKAVTIKIKYSPH
jgi:hypothetical protein